MIGLTRKLAASSWPPRFTVTSRKCLRFKCEVTSVPVWFVSVAYIRIYEHPGDVHDLSRPFLSRRLSRARVLPREILPRLRDEFTRDSFARRETLDAIKRPRVYAIRASSVFPSAVKLPFYTSRTCVSLKNGVSCRQYGRSFFFFRLIHIINERLSNVLDL